MAYSFCWTDTFGEGLQPYVYLHSNLNTFMMIKKTILRMSR